MMNRILIITSIVLLFSKQLRSQQDSIFKLQEVVVSDSKLKKFSDGFKLEVISDSLIQRNASSLTDLLTYNSLMYFKENGYGMVSSPSFRGTNASQTAVIWNGISINSNLNGQTDFNTITTNSFDAIVVRSGGGSVQYGSGAIGGSIHLENNIYFDEENNHKIKLLYGDYTTFAGNYKSTFSGKRSYIDFGVDYLSSKNDYKYLGKNQKNNNGGFNTTNISANAGLKVGTKNAFKFNSNFFIGDRDFSGTLTAPSNDNYRDFMSRNLVNWKNYTNKYISDLKIAHLFEKYKYFANKERDEFSEGKANSFITDYSFDYHISSKIKTSFIANYTQVKAEGSNIGNNTRNTLATTLLLNHKASKKFSYGLNVRQEFLNDFENPFLFSIDGKYKTSNWHALSFNGSKNYRVPTFNDLFWDAGGNNELQPETSFQAEIGNSFTLNNIKLSINAFLIEAENLINWQPNNRGVWSPINIDQVNNYGFELSLGYAKNFEQHRFTLNGNYAYTAATDKENNKQLIYVPFHKATGLLNYNFKKLTVFYQLLFNGEVFTTTDNTDTVDAYSVSNLGVEYNFNTKHKPYLIGVKANNLLNKYYENVAFRPMPNRNIQFYLNFNF